MRRNLSVITVTAVVFGLSFGVYDLVLPLWLKANDISYGQMGWIFAVSNGMMMLVPIVTGWLADRFGRKRFFATSLAACAAACAVTPLTAHLGAQTLLRILQRAATGVYETLQGVLVFETSSSRFIYSIRMARGFEFTCNALGALLVWALIKGQTDVDKLAMPMFVTASLLMAAFVLILIMLREPAVVADELAKKAKINPFGLPPVLILLAVFNFAFMFGLSISHSQMMILFFYDKFQLAEHQVAWVSIAHRVSLGLPMIIAAIWVTRPNKWLFAATVLLEGVFVSLTVFPTTVVGAVAVWFLHDPFGAAIWAPMNAWYMQKYARPERRAADVATVLAMGTLGSGIGPIIAGKLADYGGHVPAALSGAIDLPFFFSGAIVAASAIFVCFLPKARRAPLDNGGAIENTVS